MVVQRNTKLELYDIFLVIFTCVLQTGNVPFRKPDCGVGKYYLLPLFFWGALGKTRKDIKRFDLHYLGLIHPIYDFEGQ